METEKNTIDRKELFQLKGKVAPRAGMYKLIMKYS